jgi:hypothetical protein
MSAGEAVNPPRERWFLKLYPRAWRERYGAELADLVGDKPLSLQNSIDLIAGAIDARFTKGTKMPSALRTACLLKDEPQTAADGMRGAAVIIVGSLVMLGLATMARRQGWAAAGDALADLSFPVSLALMSHVMYLRKQSFKVKAIITGGTLTFLIAISIINAL